MVVSHHGCSARSERTSNTILAPAPRRRRRRALGCARGRPGSQTIREMAEGFSCFRAGCTAQINEGIVSISELMGVTSERGPSTILKTRTLRTTFTGVEEPE